MKLRFGLPAGLLATVTMLAAPSIFAADRFYQIMGADGRLQTIMAPDEVAEPVKNASTKDSEQRTDDSAADKSAKKGFWSRFKQEKKAPKQKMTLDDAPAQPANPPSGWAAYDSDSYLDSEKLDATDFNPEQKQRFYLLPDGSRIRTEEGLEPASGELFQQEKVRPLNIRPSTRLSDEYLETSPNNVLAFSLVNGCMPEPLLKKAVPLKDSLLVGVMMDKKARAFAKPGEVLAAYDMGWHQGGWLFVRSYAGTERKPKFIQPVVVLTDEKGCVQRVLSGYFQRQYAATKTRYSELEGEIKLAENEALVFLVVPKDSAVSPRKDYTLSRYGKVAIKWIR